MLTFNFTRIFKARGIVRPFKYLVKAGYSETFATKIANDRYRRMNLDEIEKLCELLKCTPNDLLEWIPERNDSSIEEHPLSSLRRKDTFFNLAKVLSSVPLDKLDEIESMITKAVEKKD